ncbi:MAG TPA: NUDIX domain-containing protein [Candidatus Paceibacterota bacterium]|nr:NUDIX domain-containing protein [Candidatus Paceibacterota bacterium]
MRLVSLLFIVDGDKVLLGKKKERPGKTFGAGYWNGFGGGVEEGETIEESACRETLEECGLTVKPEDLKKVAHINFEFAEKPDYNHDAHVFVTQKFSGEPTETEEMAPAWHDINNLPLSEMWPADVHWVPLVLSQNKTIEAHCVFIGSEKPFPVGSFEYTETKF